ncbi:MAG: hypothetical protein IJ521_00195 [Schwartzia sp.]|nr:hypothetical protein [Schwartzia sp. (in: firmicutes)]
MAQIIINKGFLSQGGRLYKAGEIVTIADNGYAKRIVARSGGDFDFYHGEAVPADDTTEVQTTDAISDSDAGGNDESDAGGVSESDNGGDGGDLPAFDAAAAVQTAKTAKGKKK